MLIVDMWIHECGRIQKIHLSSVDLVVIVCFLIQCQEIVFKASSHYYFLICSTIFCTLLLQILCLPFLEDAVQWFPRTHSVLYEHK